MMANPKFVVYIACMGLILFVCVVVPLVYRFSPSLKLVEWMYTLPPWRRLPRGCPELPNRAEKIAVGDWATVRVDGPGNHAVIRITVTAVGKKMGRHHRPLP